jgi:hypothetical protein
MRTFFFGSISGSTLAVYFFLLFSLLVGVTVYGLMRFPQTRRFGGMAGHQATSLVTAAAAAMTVFLAFYFSSINAFYVLEATNGQLRLEYILPSRVRVLSRSDISDIQRRPSYKGQWQLVIHTFGGTRYRSAQSTYDAVTKAWENLNALRSDPDGR